MRKPLKYEDAEAIREEAPSVKEVCVEMDSTSFMPGHADLYSHGALQRQGSDWRWTLRA